MVAQFSMGFVKYLIKIFYLKYSRIHAQNALDRVVVLVTHGKNDILPAYQVRKALIALDFLGYGQEE